MRERERERYACTYLSDLVGVSEQPERRLLVLPLELVVLQLYAPDVHLQLVHLPRLQEEIEGDGEALCF